MGINDDLIEDYRNYITNTILSNETIVKLLSNDKFTLDEADELLYGDDPHVQPHEFIPGTVGLSMMLNTKVGKKFDRRKEVERTHRSVIRASKVNF